MYKVAILALLVLFVPLTAFAAPSIELETRDTNIQSLDTVLVTGKVLDVNSYTPSTLTVIAPDGETIYAYQIQPSSDGTIKRLIHPPLPSFKEGTYTVILSHPDLSQTAQIEFTVTPESITRKDMQVSSPEPIVPETSEEPDSFNPFFISADAVAGDTVINIVGKTILRDQAITLTVKSPQGNLVTVAQVMPQANGEFAASIKTGGPLWTEDGLYTVTAHQGWASELEHSITVGIQDGVVIPEFGTIAALILAVAIISIIGLTKTRTSIFPRI